MSRIVSSVAATVGVGLATFVVAGGFATSSARFSASTDNTQNLWQAAELTLSVGGDGLNAGLFLNGTGIYPGLEQSNCVLVSAETSLDNGEVRLHARSINDDGLGSLYDVQIERGEISGGCERFVPAELLYAGTLGLLAEQHGSHASGLVAGQTGAESFPLRFIGQVQDTNLAQGLAIDYVVHLELKP